MLPIGTLNRQKSSRGTLTEQRQILPMLVGNDSKLDLNKCSEKLKAQSDTNVWLLQAVFLLPTLLAGVLWLA